MALVSHDRMVIDNIGEINNVFTNLEIRYCALLVTFLGNVGVRDGVCNGCTV